MSGQTRSPPSKLLDPHACQDVSNINVAVGSNGDVMWPDELAIVVAKSTKGVDDLSVQINNEYACPIRRRSGQVAAVDHIHIPVRTHADGPRPPVLSTFPFRQKSPGIIEDLNALITAIGNIHFSRLVQRDSMRLIKLAWSCSFCSPLEEQAPLR